MRKVWTKAQVEERGRIFLQASVGEIPVNQACEKLGISRQRFYELEDRAVDGFLKALAPKLPGRPAKPEDPTLPLARQIELLQKENVKLLLFAKVLRKLAGIEDREKKSRPRKKAATDRGEAHDR